MAMITPAPAREDDATITRWALAAREGDGEAVDRFVRALQADVRRFVAHLADDSQAADDLTQDTGDWQRAAERAQPRCLPGFEEGVVLMHLIDSLPVGTPMTTAC